MLCDIFLRFWFGQIRSSCIFGVFQVRLGEKWCCFLVFNDVMGVSIVLLG